MNSGGNRRRLEWLILPLLCRGQPRVHRRVHLGAGECRALGRGLRFGPDYSGHVLRRQNPLYRPSKPLKPNVCGICHFEGTSTFGNFSPGCSKNPPWGILRPRTPLFFHLRDAPLAVAAAEEVAECLFRAVGLSSAAETVPQVIPLPSECPLCSARRYQVELLDAPSSIWLSIKFIHGY